MAVVKPEAQHFAIRKCRIPQYRFYQSHQAEITGSKPATCEPEARQIGIRKITMLKNTIFVFSFFRWFHRKIPFVEHSTFTIYVFHEGKIKKGYDRKDQNQARSPTFPLKNRGWKLTSALLLQLMKP